MQGLRQSSLSSSDVAVSHAGQDQPPGAHKRACLTERNLKAHTKLENMRRHKKELKGSSHSGPGSSLSKSKSVQTDETKSSSKTRFRYLAYANGILQEPNAKAPVNLKSHQDRLDRSRSTVSPTKSEYEVATHKLLVAENEGTLAEETSKLLKDHRLIGYRRAINLPLKDFPKNVGLNDGLSAAQPDVIEGLEMPEFSPFPVHGKLGGAATPYSSPNAITLPHLAGELKGPGKDLNLARLQAAYDGAHMVYARNKARSYLESPDPPGQAFVSTFTTDGTILNTYLHYSSQSQGEVKYHQFPTSTTLLRSSYEGFKTARRRVRNNQDDAKENSEKLRDELTKRWSASQQYLRDEDSKDEGDDNDNSHFSPPVSLSLLTKTADVQHCDQEDSEDQPSDQLLTEMEYYTGLFENKGEDEDEDEDEDFIQIPTPDASSSVSRPQRKNKKKRSRLC